jgi:murein DD-endopeptidase MepM/ murein hydrolase activator NlpD
MGPLALNTVGIHRARWARWLRVLARRHPRSVAGSTALVLGSFAATAFGIAPLAPDASDLPSRTVVSSFAITDLAQQIDGLSQHRFALFRSETVRLGDTADSLLKRLGAADPQMAAFLRRDATARKLVEGKAGKRVRAEVDTQGRVVSLTARTPMPSSSGGMPTQFQRWIVERNAQGDLVSRTEVGDLRPTVRLGSGVIESNLFAAVDAADIPDPVAVQMVDMFSTDVDFHRELRRGDRFNVVYETLTADGEPITLNQGSGRVLAAEFTSKGKTHAAVWYEGLDGRGSYFGLDGQNKRRSFLASPLEFSRVTSGFAMRMHPILNTWRQHKGIDYGAPAGTAVRSVGDGTVEFAGWQNGYGNVVEVQHAKGKSTLYAHLSRIDVKKGQTVVQGANLGAVGATGWATGPHLHFEFKINGEQQDPMLIAQAADAVTVPPAETARFQESSRTMRARLELARSLATGDTARGATNATAAALQAPRTVSTVATRGS